jgi:hypothetical protein
MASAIRAMTGVGGDIRKIARLLQKKAPPGHMLAYINQEEADLLKARGGSGQPHADTGVPSFQTQAELDIYDQYYTGTPVQSMPDTTVTSLDLTSTQAPSYQTAGEQKYLADQSSPPAVDMSAVRDTENPLFPEYQQYLRGQANAFGDYAAAPSGSRYTDENISGSLRDSAARVAAAPTQDKDLLGQASEWFGSLGEDTKKRLGIASIQGLIGAYQSQQASEQGRKAKEEMQRMAQPYQQQGKQLIAQAQRGELSAVGQQQLQAVQAQAAQGAQARGGVGAQQAQAQVEAYRQQLLQGQYDLGLKVSGIGDNIAMGAIKTGLEADRYVNQLTNNYFTNIARTAYGQAPQVSGSPTYVRAEA